MKDDFKNLIWSNRNLDYKDWKADLEAEYPDESEEKRLELMYETNTQSLDDERINLNIQLTQPIIVIAELGLWNGRFKGYKMINSCNIKDCLYSDCEFNEWYLDKLGDLCCTAIHHDGTNHYFYRAFKDSATSDQIANLQNKIYSGKATRHDITRVTKRLGDEISAVYGFDIPSRTEKAYER